MKKITGWLLPALFFLSCKKESGASSGQTTFLEITVKSISGTVVPDVTVQLYPSFTDWENRTNIIQTKKTGSNGKAIYTGLTNIKYYYLAWQDCFSNGFNNVSTAGAITLNTTNFAETTIDQAGALIFKNTSNNPYRVYLNGVANFDLPGNTTKTLSYKPTGPYTIRVLQLSGYVVTPTDQTYTGILVCGGSLTTTFP